MLIPYRKISIPNYKVKAFFGDSILEFVLTKRIYEKNFSTLGKMASRLSRLKSNRYLSKIYDYIVWKRYIYPDDRDLSVHGRATIVEAFFCYVYQDKGLEYTEQLINYLYDATKRWKK